MANKYWVGGGSSTNWNATTSTNWANSDGGPGNQTAPAAGDAVFFTASSGTGAVVMNVSISLTGFDCTGSKNQLTHNSSITITITGGNVKLPDGAGGSYTAAAATSLFTFTSTSGTRQLKSNGNVMGAVTVNGAGQTVQTQDALNVTAAAGSTLTITSGTFDSQSYTVSCALLVSTGSTTRVVTGSGAYSISNSQNAVITTLNLTSTGITVTGWTGPITLSGTFTTANQHSVVLAGLSLGPITYNANTGGGPYNIGNFTTSSFTINGPNTIQAATATTQTISAAGTLNFAGTPTGQILFAPADLITTGSTVSAASGTISMNWTAFRGHTFSGGATFIARNSFDFGANTGITIYPPSGVNPSRLALGH